MNALRNLSPVWIAVAIAVAVALWMASGMLGNGASEAVDTSGQHSSGKPDAKGNEDAGKPKIRVKVRISHTQPIMRTAELSARTAAVRKVRVRAQIAGRVAEVVATRGAHVKAGDIIVRLDPADLQARLSKARALLSQRRLQYKAAQKMAEQGYQSTVGLATAKANLEAAQATVASIRTKLDYTTIEAPFDGVLEQLPVEVGDFVSVGDVIGQVIQQEPFIVRGRAPEDIVALLEPGQPGTATLISGKTYQGTVRFISSVADPQTRTYRVELRIDPPSNWNGLIAGASAQMRLPLERVSAHRVEPAILTLNAEGVFGIKSVTKQGIVRFHKAEVVRNANGFIWLAGMPRTLRIITVGQGFVRPGDKVAYTLEDTASSRQAVRTEQQAPRKAQPQE